MTDSMGPGKLVRHMQNPSYTYDEYLICIGLGPSISSVICKNLSYSGPLYPSSPVYIYMYVCVYICVFIYWHYRYEWVKHVDWWYPGNVIPSAEEVLSLVPYHPPHLHHPNQGHPHESGTPLAPL